MPHLTAETTTATQAPTIRIDFILDEAGEPKFAEHEDHLGARRRHYRIRVSLASPPEDTWSVTFYLDESYGSLTQ